MGNPIAGLPDALLGAFKIKAEQKNQALEREKLDLLKTSKTAEIAAKDRQQLIDLLTARTNERKAQLEEDTLKFNKGKEFFEVFGKLNAGRTDITPDEVKAQTDLFDKLFEVPVDKARAMYKPITDKMGEIKSFRFDNADSIKSEFDNLLKKAQTDQVKADTVLKGLEGKKIQNEIAQGKFSKTFQEWFIRNTPDLTTDKLLDFAQKLKVAETTGSGIQLETNPDGSIKSLKIGTNKLETGDKLSPATRTEIEKRLVGYTDEAWNLNEVSKSYMKEALTWKGQFKNWSLDKVAKADPKLLTKDQKQFIGKYADFQMTAGRFFDAYRLEVTKSQAALKELEMLKRNVMNSDMSAPVWEYNITKATNRINRQIRIKRMLLDNGLYGDENSNSFWDKFDEEIQGLGDPTLEPGQIDKRGNQLRDIFSKKYSSKEEIDKQVVFQLKKEGYLQ